LSGFASSGFEAGFAGFFPLAFPAGLDGPELPGAEFTEG
jgi:hypothetical protein